MQRRFQKHDPSLSLQPFFSPSGVRHSIDAGNDNPNTTMMVFVHLHGGGVFTEGLKGSYFTRTP